MKEVIELSYKFSNDVEVLSVALILSSYESHLAVVKWLVGYIAADVIYANSEERSHTPLTAVCDYNRLDIVKDLVEICYADVNLPNSRGNTSLTMACYNNSIPVSMYLLCEM